MASRLDKLYDLLESNNGSIRSAAIIQIGQIANNSNVKLDTLLSKLLPYIKSKTWSVRLAAADVLKEIGLNIKSWVPNRLFVNTNNSTNNCRYISLKNLDILKVLNVGTRLYSTDEIDNCNSTYKTNKDEINKYLGIALPESDIKDLMTQDECTDIVFVTNKPTISIAEAVNDSIKSETKDEKKSRKRKLIEPKEGSQKNKTLKLESISAQEEDNNDWPWSILCDELLQGLWNPNWEIRHGCATALREIARTQGSVMISSKWKEENFNDFNQAHNQYLEDIIGRLLCTLGLDQVSDFVSDEMIAPVRESCAQAIGIISMHINADLIQITNKHLLSLLGHSEWTVSHGALLGIKYILAARIDLLETLLPELYASISNFLRDSRDDDIRCAAASALMPLFGKTIKSIETLIDINVLRNDLWMVLSMQSDYTATGAIGALLQLIEKVYNLQFQNTSNVETNLNASEELEKSLLTNINKLHWCYFNYGKSIRLFAVQTCSAILKFYQPRFNLISNLFWYQVLTHLLQRILIDESKEVSDAAETLWNWIVGEVSFEVLAHSCWERIDVWLCMAMQPSRMPFDSTSNMIILPDDINNINEPNVNNESESNYHLPQEFYIGGRQLYLAEGDSNYREECVLEARISVCRALGRLLSKLFSFKPLADHFLINVFAQIHLKDKAALQRFIASMVLAYINCNEEWILQNYEITNKVKDQIVFDLLNPTYYHEILPIFNQMLKSCRDLINCYVTNGIAIPPNLSNSGTMNLQECQLLVSDDLYKDLMRKNINDEPRFANAKSSVTMCFNYHEELSRMVEVSLSRALLSWNWLPTKLTPILKPLMETMRFDCREPLQKEAVFSLAYLLVNKSSEFPPSFNKLLRNVCNSYSEAVDNTFPLIELENGILMLYKIDQLGRDVFPAQESLTEIEVDVNMTKLRGCKMVLIEMCKNICQMNKFDKLNLIVEMIFKEPISLLNNCHENNLNKLITDLRALEICIMHSKEFIDKLVNLNELTECLFNKGLSHNNMAVRHWSSRILAALMMSEQIITNDSVLNNCRNVLDSLVFDKAVEILNVYDNEIHCMGIIEMLYLIMHRGYLGYRLSLIVTLVPVILRSSNVNNEYIRRVSTLMFSLILTLMPLEQSNSDFTILTNERIEQRKSSRVFIEGLMKPDSIETYDVSKIVSVDLRHYQQLGVNWLGFLKKYGLHGILADDMGLGKTIQTLCIIAGEYYRDGMNSKPSLIVCPSTLTRHWLQEVKRHIRLPNFNSLLYVGNSEARQLLQKQICKYQLIITSYDILRNDMDYLLNPKGSSNSWNYLVLDEGHLIRNHKSKLAFACKSINAKHRLVLTGTPIQNNVGELWSLFDFLMPGLLGNSHTIFHRKYGRHLSQTAASAPTSTATGYSSILSNNNAPKKVDSEQGTVALDALHKQVLPFILRRIKEDVLNELPPKIMQDYTCLMTPLQSRLYASITNGQKVVEDLIGNQDDNEIDTTSLSSSINSDQRKHVFQALHQLRLVCNHPSLILNAKYPQYDSIMRELKLNSQNINDIDLSGKLVALKQLILDCGIGGDDSVTNNEQCYSTVVSSHRLLIFCQSKSMIALIQKMLEIQIPKASFLKLDGSINIKNRQEIVDKFNDDPSVDILLLTTSIGGLGLNLTSADTVIFAEHDWNPMRDLQAMDRAHRLGQKKTVNVYRLITADSIEERIMNLQQFKLYVANSVVSGTNINSNEIENSSSSILDIMNRDNINSSDMTKDASNKTNNYKMKDILKGLDTMYKTADDYSEEYSLDNFIDKL